MEQIIVNDCLVEESPSKVYGNAWWDKTTGTLRIELEWFMNGFSVGKRTVLGTVETKNQALRNSFETMDILKENYAPLLGNETMLLP